MSNFELTPTLKIAKGAHISADKQYRYMLWRIWDKSLPRCTFIGLNPSTADHQDDDNTIRRCINYAMSWGCGTLYMVNLFAYRATKPEDMIAAANPIGTSNDNWLRWACGNADIIVCAWGNHGAFNNRATEVTELLKCYQLKCFGLSKTKQPLHPLYQKSDCKLQPFNENSLGVS